MTTYSHSRISTFENCPYQYKLKYVDKIKVDIPNTVEAFMGGLVHESLEKLYKDLKYQKMLSLSEVLDFYHALWEEKWDDKILIVKKDYTAENYKDMGKKFITDYYNQYHPFDQMTILGLETQDVMLLPDGNHYHVRIDKLACVGNTYYICDYKTNSSMKKQEDADSDRQLAMYSIWVKDRYKDASKVVLMWHMLAFGKDVTSSRTEKELQELQSDTVKLIKKIEDCSTYKTNVTNLCSYCVYKEMCPAFSHKIKLEAKKKPSKDSGLKLVDELSALEIVKKETESRIDEIKEELIEYSKEYDATIIYGSEKKAAVKEYETIIYPEDKEKLINALKKKDLYEEYSQISYPKLTSNILKGEIDKTIIKMIEKKKDWKVSVSKKE